MLLSIQYSLPDPLQILISPPPKLELADWSRSRDWFMELFMEWSRDWLPLTCLVAGEQDTDSAKRN